MLHIYFKCCRFFSIECLKTWIHNRVWEPRDKVSSGYIHWFHIPFGKTPRSAYHVFTNQNKTWIGALINGIQSCTPDSFQTKLFPGFTEILNINGKHFLPNHPVWAIFIIELPTLKMHTERRPQKKAKKNGPFCQLRTHVSESWKALNKNELYNMKN